MKVLHVSAECYPAAKAGGLGDVVGALPRYQNEASYPAAVVIPKYRTKWVKAQRFVPVFTSTFPMQNDFVPFSIEKLVDDLLGFPLYVVNILGQFDRPGVYGDPQSGWYKDNTERFIGFQTAVMQWLLESKKRPEVIHCHDYHAGLIPFLLQHGIDYRSMAGIPSVFTIHNAEYHGNFGWEKVHLLPPFDARAKGLLEWNHQINPLAAAIKSAWKFTTVSPTYMRELAQEASGMELLIREELGKSGGVLNGIDSAVWDPSSDTFIADQYSGDLAAYKQHNKSALQARFKARLDLPVITFIGRLVREKGADLLPDLYRQVLETGLDVTFLVLGTGEPKLHEAFLALKESYPDRFDVVLGYDEGLAHQLYAGSDFLIMPSRVEPCGLNQMYAMRYGTIPVVRSTGGLKDTVIDIAEAGGQGRGIRFDQFNLGDGHHAVWRAFQLYHNAAQLEEVRRRIMQLDFSWDQSAKSYINLYKQLK